MLQERDTYKLLGSFIANEIAKQLAPVRDALDELKENIEQSKRRDAVLQTSGSEFSARIERIEKVLADMPVPVNGKDGASVVVDDVLPSLMTHGEMVLRELFEEWPKPKDGKNGADGKDGRDGTDGTDGKALSVDEILPAVSAAVADAVSRVPAARGISSCLVDHSGGLVVTFSDGATQNVGIVVGKDGASGRDAMSRDEIVELIADAVEQIPKPKDGKDGLGFKDMSVTFDGERNLIFRFVLDERTEEMSLTVPFMIYRGVWKQGGYERGDVVTRDGSMFVALQDTLTTPATKESDWQLCCKRGQNGKDGEKGATGPQGPQGLDAVTNGVTQWPLKGS